MNRPLLLALALFGLAAVAAGCSDDSDVNRAVSGEAQVVPEKFQFSKLSPGQHEDRVVQVKNVAEGPLAVLGIDGQFGNEEEFELFRRRLDGNGEYTVDEYIIESDGEHHGVYPIILEKDDILKLVLNWTPSEQGDGATATGSVVLETNLPDGEIVIPIVTGDSGAEIKVIPQTLDFGRVPAGTEKRMETTLTNIGNWPLIVQQIVINGSDDFTAFIDGKNPEEDLEVLRDPDGDGKDGLAAMTSVTIEVLYAPPTEGFDDAELSIISKSRNTAEVKVNLIANGATPCVRVVPGELAYGAAMVGGQASKFVVVESCGGENLVINGVDIDENSDSAFRLDTDALPEPLQADPQEPESIPAQVRDQAPASRDITVLFSPEEEKTYEGWLHIRTNDPVTPIVTVPLNGRGMLNLCPEPVVGNSEFRVLPLDIVNLDGSASVDPDGPNNRPVKYEWAVIDRPPDSTALPVERYFERSRPADGGDPDDPSTPGALFFVDLVGTYTIELRVTDNMNLSAPSELCPEPTAIITIDAKPEEDIHVQMVWTTPGDEDETNTEGSDVDLHFMHPRNLGWMMPPTDCYYANPSPDWGRLGSPDDNPSLDIDDTNGAGPENVNLNNPENTGDLGAPYIVGVHYYRSDEFFGGRDWGSSYVTVRIYLGGELSWENGQAKELRRTDDFWEVAGIIWSGNDRRVQLIDRVTRLALP